MDRFEIGTRVKRNGSSGTVVRSFKSKRRFQGIVVRWDDSSYDAAYMVPEEGPCEFRAEAHDR